jgi:hypothetical protein
VRLTKVVAPVTSPNRHYAQLGDDDGGTDCSSDFLRRLDAQTDVSLRVTNDNNRLEPSSLTGTGLLLHGLDLQFEKESVNPGTLSRSPNLE